jgi:hypothetical protein
VIVVNSIALDIMLLLTLYAKSRAFNNAAKRAECALIITQFTTLAILVENSFPERNMEE